MGGCPLAGGGAGGGKQGVEMMRGEIESRQNKQLQPINKILLQPFANKLRKEMTKSRGMSVEIRPAGQTDEGVSI